MAELPTVEAYEDSDWDGAWVKCPHCEHENGTTWSGSKKCNNCEKKFEVSAGPLVRDPGEQ